MKKEKRMLGDKSYCEETDKRRSRKLHKYLLVGLIVVLVLNLFPFGRYADNVVEAVTSTEQKQNSEDGIEYTEIHSAEELDTLIRKELNGNFKLVKDIDLSDYRSNTNTANQGWLPIPNFTGVFNGNGHTISGLRINRTGSSFLGLFGSVNGATIKNVTVTLGGDILGSSAVGVIAGRTTHVTNNGAILENNQVIGNGHTVRATALLGYAGGLIGYSGDNTRLENNQVDHINVLTNGVSNYAGGLVGAARNSSLFDNAINRAKVEAYSYAGGIAGVTYGYSAQAHSNGTLVTKNIVDTESSVQGRGSYAGGAFGAIYEGSEVRQTLTHAKVVGKGSYNGGFAGVIYDRSTVDQSAAYGSVEAVRYTGGFVGALYNSASVSNSYARGAVTGTTELGGFVGTFYDSAIIENSYAANTIHTDERNQERAGAFAGQHLGTRQQYAGTNYFDQQIAGITQNLSNAGGEQTSGARPQGKDTQEFSQSGTFDGWDFEDTWIIDKGYPVFQFSYKEPDIPKEIEEPMIIVHTAFPEGEVTVPFIDIEYTATPTIGNEIIEVYVKINGNFDSYLYLKGGNGITPKGELGTGRVFFRPIQGENHIEVVAFDSSGVTGSYKVDQPVKVVEHPVPDSPKPEEISTEFFWEDERTFVNNRFQLWLTGATVEERKNVTPEMIEEALASIDATLLIEPDWLGQLTVQVKESTAEELIEMIEDVIENFPEVFEDGNLDTLDDASTNEVTPVETMSNKEYFPDDPWWNNDEWGLRAINLPEAWALFGTHERENVKVGIIDDGVWGEHEDLQIPAGNIENDPNAKLKTELSTNDHGTHVMGTIGAIQDNQLGVSGVINISRQNLLSYNSFDGIATNRNTGKKFLSTSANAQLSGLKWNVENGVQVVNVSIGGRGFRFPQWGRFNIFIRKTQRLVDENYEFVIVHAAGNNAIDARYGQSFSNIGENHALRERIITVGATMNVNNQVEMWSDTNYGTIIDVVAPGHDIKSASSVSKDLYVNKNGTSMAAPHVAGLAALVWSENPGLSGAQVKGVITQSAIRSGLKVTETRPNTPEMTYYQVNAFEALKQARGVDPDRDTVLIRGKVRQESTGYLLENARVHLYQNNKLLEQTWTNSLGEFRFFNQPSGHDYRITVHYPWHIAARINNFSVPEGIKERDVGTVVLHDSSYLGIDTVFLLDDSGSISANNFRQMTNEVQALFLNEDAFTSDDRISLFTFNSRVNRHFSFLNPLLAAERLPRQVGGSTALNQAIAQGNHEFEQYGRKNAKKVMVVLTDGHNNVSGPPEVQLIQQAKENDVTIFSIGVGNNLNQRFLDTIARETGGEFFHISNFQQLAEIFEKIRYELFDEDIQKLQIELSETSAHNLQTTNVESERLAA
ncbi:S8 family serine peptidase [Enterococcus casseliflavus]|uniref:S8 family serine peptidase n=1 Tax=Enterococcus casseliflavus TaxID=37734 RepID=UPI0039A4DC68